MEYTKENLARAFTEIDAVLMPWLKQNTLYVYKWFRDDPVRIVDVVDDAGNISKINVYPSSASGVSDIIVAGYGNICRGQASVPELRPALDKALQQILEWVEQAGLTRTPV